MTTNDVVKAHYSPFQYNTKTGEYELRYNTKTHEDRVERKNEPRQNFYLGTFIDGEINIRASYYRYEYIREDLVIKNFTFKIEGDIVYNSKGEEIGIFYPNWFSYVSYDNIPNTQGCDKYWSDNFEDIYYDADSEFANEKTEKYNDRVIFFCSEEEAVEQGYSKYAN